MRTIMIQRALHALYDVTHHFYPFANIVQNAWRSTIPQQFKRKQITLPLNPICPCPFKTAHLRDLENVFWPGVF